MGASFTSPKKERIVGETIIKFMKEHINNIPQSPQSPQQWNFREWFHHDKKSVDELAKYMSRVVRHHDRGEKDVRFTAWHHAAMPYYPIGGEEEEPPQPSGYTDEFIRFSDQNSNWEFYVYGDHLDISTNGGFRPTSSISFFD